MQWRPWGGFTTDPVGDTTADLDYSEASDTNANFQTITPSDVASLDYG